MKYALFLIIFSALCIGCKHNSNVDQPIQFVYESSINSTFSFPNNILKTNYANLHYIDTLQLSQNEIKCIELKLRSCKLDTIKNSLNIHRINYSVLPSYNNLILYNTSDSAIISFNSITRLIPDKTSRTYKFIVYNFEKEKSQYEKKHHNIIRFKLTLDSILSNNKTFEKRRVQVFNYMTANPSSDLQ